jgi:hypothetical protein
MKLIDALRNVDKSQPYDAQMSDFVYEFGLNDGWSDKFGQRVKQYYLIKWMCSDTWVGVCAYFFDDELVAMSEQMARKGDTNISFVSKEAAEKIKAFIVAILAEEEGEPTYNIINPDEEVRISYTVAYSNELLDKEGYVDGMPCKVVDTFRKDYLSKKVMVQFENNGKTAVVPTSNFKILLNLEDNAWAE